MIQFGPSREISLRAEKASDIMIFTDGFTPDQRKDEAGPDRIGAVMFDRRACRTEADLGGDPRGGLGQVAP